MDGYDNKISLYVMCLQIHSKKLYLSLKNLKEINAENNTRWRIQQAAWGYVTPSQIWLYIHIHDAPNSMQLKDKYLNAH